MDVAEHLGGIILEGTGDVDVPFQVDAHHGLELPQGQFHGAFRIVQVRDGGRDVGFRPGEVQFRRLGGVVAHLGEAIILHRVLIDGVIHVVRFLGEQDAEEGLLDGGDGAETGFPGLLHGQFHLVAGEPEALPELEIHQGHLRVDTEVDRVGTAHLDRLGGGLGVLAGFGDIRDERGAGRFVQVHDVIHDGLHQAGHHPGHAAAGGRGGFPVIIGFVGTEIDLLLLEGVTVHAGSAYLRKQGGIGTLLRILLPLDLHVRDLHGRVLAERDFQGVVQGQDHLLLPGCLILVLRSGRNGQECACEKDD